MYRLILRSGSSSRTSLRLLGEIPIRHHFRQGEFVRFWARMAMKRLNRLYANSISTKMLDFGASERWPAKYCARKWEEIHPERVPFQSQPSLFPELWDTRHGSPVESLGQSPRPH